MWLRKIPPSVGWYFSGFTDGEGSFNVSILRTPERRFGWRLMPRFNVSQRDRTVLELMQKYLGCGILRSRKDGVTYFDVTNIALLAERIIPFFEEYLFASVSKQRNFSIFKKIVTLMSQNAHQKFHGIKKILRLRETLNEGKGRKRKYEVANMILEKSSETSRQTSEIPKIIKSDLHGDMKSAVEISAPALSNVMSEQH